MRTAGNVRSAARLAMKLRKNVGTPRRIVMPLSREPVGKLGESALLDVEGIRRRPVEQRAIEAPHRVGEGERSVQQEAIALRRPRQPLAMVRASASTFRCVWTTPFGVPVEPDV
jgi:hypothetical protein